MEVIISRIDSSAGNTQIQLQVGDIGGFDTSSYNINLFESQDAGAVNVTIDINASGFEIGVAFNAAQFNNTGSWKIKRVEIANGLEWMCEWDIRSDQATAAIHSGNGRHDLSENMDRARINRANTSGAFNNGLATLRYTKC